MTEPTDDEQTSPLADQPQVEQAEVVDPSEGDEAMPAVSEPAKVMRVGTMIKELLAEVRNSSLDEASRERLRDIYDTSVRELSGALSDDLREELERLALPFDDDTPERGRAAGGQSAAGGLARRPFPRHPGDVVRAADGGPSTARGHAGQPAAGGHAAAGRPFGTTRSGRSGRIRWPGRPATVRRRPSRHLPVAQTSEASSRWRRSGRVVVPLRMTPMSFVHRLGTGAVDEWWTARAGSRER